MAMRASEYGLCLLCWFRFLILVVSARSVLVLARIFLSSFFLLLIPYPPSSNISTRLSSILFLCLSLLPCFVHSSYALTSVTRLRS
ncbi:hypothetical protein C8R46DRAFT_113607 [Mycena filopes]|nr:hypothetical protein C8R46DRAFT_113607 [Mycena filopes]